MRGIGSLRGDAVRAAILGVALSCAACSSDYYSRRDTLSAGTGDAVDANIAGQVVNPRPASAYRVGGTTDGEYLQHAIERYENPAAGTALGAPPTAVPVGAEPVVR